MNAGQVIENRMTVESLTLKAVQMVAPQQYLGRLQLQLNPIGDGIVLSRAISLFMQTDTTGSITSCSRALQNPIDSARGIYSETCTDFAAKGWSSKQTCLQDGRWHRVYSTNASGGVAFGTLNDLTNHIDGGAEARIGVPPGTLGFSGFSDLCSSTARMSAKLVCLTHFRAGVPDWASESLSEPSALSYYTNGHLLLGGNATTGSANIVTLPMHWWIKY